MIEHFTTPYIHGLNAGLQSQPILAPHSAEFRRGWYEGRVIGAERWLMMHALERKFQADWARGQVKMSQPQDATQWQPLST